MQYSLFTHGTALQIETPNTLAGSIKFGWGTQITFPAPVLQVINGLPVYDDQGPGSWFHMPLTSTLNTFGRRNPYLKSVTLLFNTDHCRILHVHVYDGFNIIQEFNDFKFPKTAPLKGDFLNARNSDDMNPEAPPKNQTFRNTLKLDKSHKVFSTIGISFYACAFREDFNEQGHVHNPDQDGPFPPSILTVAGGGAQFNVEDPFSPFTAFAKVVNQILDGFRGPKLA